MAGETPGSVPESETFDRNDSIWGEDFRFISHCYPGDQLELKLVFQDYKGWASSRYMPDQKSLRLMILEVEEESQSQGVGSKIFKEFLKEVDYLRAQGKEVDSIGMQLGHPGILRMVASNFDESRITPSIKEIEESLANRKSTEVSIDITEGSDNVQES